MQWKACFIDFSWIFDSKTFFQLVWSWVCLCFPFLTPEHFIYQAPSIQLQRQHSAGLHPTVPDRWAPSISLLHDVILCCTLASFWLLLIYFLQAIHFLHLFSWRKHNAEELWYSLMMSLPSWSGISYQFPIHATIEEMCLLSVVEFEKGDCTQLFKFMQSAECRFENR